MVRRLTRVNFDGTAEGDAAYMFSADWDGLSLRTGLGSEGLMEWGADIDAAAVDFSLAYSGGYAGFDRSYALGTSFFLGGSTVAFSYGKTSARSLSTYALSVITEFDVVSLFFGYGYDKGGAATGFENAIGGSLDFFVGDAGKLSLGIGQLQSPTSGNVNRIHSEFSYDYGFGEIVAGIGHQSGFVGEVGVKFSF